MIRRGLRVLGAPVLWCGTLAAAAEVVVERDVPYAVGQVAAQPDATEFQTRPLLLDVYRDAAPAVAPRPGVLLLHGGSFRTGSKDHRELTALARRLAEEGFVAFVANYRLLDDHPPAPPPFHLTTIQRTVHAAVVDTKAATRFIRASHARFGVDPRRVGVVGDSAGAIAAIAAGVTGDDRFLMDRPDDTLPPENHPGQSSRPDALVDLWGSAELVLSEFDPGDPPMLIVHGTADDHIGVYFTVALNIRAACERHGIPHRFVPIEGAKHGAWRHEVDGKSVPDLIVEFLREHLAAR